MWGGGDRRREHCLACLRLRGFAWRTLPGVTTADAELAQEALLCQLGRVGQQATPVSLCVDVALWAYKFAGTAARFLRFRCSPPQQGYPAQAFGDSRRGAVPAVAA